MEVLILLLLMFLPFAIAVTRGNSNAGAVLAVNLFLGWTGIGWFVALIMAVRGDKKTQAVVVVNMPIQPQESYTQTVTSDWSGSRRLVPLVPIAAKPKQQKGKGFAS